MELKDSNLAKFKADVFFKDQVFPKKAITELHNEVPTNLLDVASKNDKNIVLFENNSLLYCNLEPEMETIYINELALAKEEQPTDLIMAKSLIEKYQRKTTRTETTIDKSTGGLFINIPDNTIFNKTLKIIVISSNEDNLAHSIIKVGKNSKIEIELCNYSKTDVYVNNVYDLILDEKAIANVKIIDSLSDKTRIYNAIRPTLESDSNLCLVNVNVNNMTLFDDLFAKLIGKGASITIKNAAVTDKNMIDNTNVWIDHEAVQTVSRIENYAITKGHSIVKYNNASYIAKDMNKSDCSQLSKGIVMSKESVISVNPFLYTYCFDVKASHGATIGSFLSDELFYLMSRGLTQKESENLIVGALVEPIVSQITDEKFHKLVVKAVNQRIGGNFE